jgi:hypothetical protein
VRPTVHRRLATIELLLGVIGGLCVPASLRGEVPTPVPQDQRGRLDAERSGTHDAANIRTVFWNFGMVGDYPADPGNVDLSVFHSVEVPKGSGMNYSDGVTPFVLAKVQTRGGIDAYIMETGFRERQGISPYYNRVMRFEPRPGYFEPDPRLNPARSPAISSDPRTWPDSWPDRLDDPDDPGWRGSWNGYFGKRTAADQESYMVMDDDFYDAFDFRPDARDSTRHGLGLRIEVRGFQWANPQASNVIFWHYDITNEGTTDYKDNIIFGLYMDSGVGGSALSCDGIYESDDDNAFFDRSFNEQILNLVYTWDNGGHGRDLSGPCGRTGYLGYAYLETPGNPFDGIDNDEDGITDERRDGGPGQNIVGEDAIRAYVATHYDQARFEVEYGPIESRLAFRAGTWWTGDEDMDWSPELHDVGADGVPDTHDTGEGDGIPTPGEPNFDQTDLNESDQIGLTGFKLNRIRAGQGNPDTEVDGIVFYNDSNNWPARLYQKFTDPVQGNRFDPPLVSNYNIGFLFASGPFQLLAGKSERFSLALAYGGDLNELRRTVRTVQQIYNANYQFAVPPKLPTAWAEVGNGYVQLSWDDVAERGADPVTGEYDFEGYSIYRSTDPDFRDPRVITTGTGSGPIGNGRPIAQFDLVDGFFGFSDQTVEGVAFYLGNETGLTHTWRDTTVVNGQQYYYAVTAYDRGSQAFGFYPSENAITVSRNLRGGTILAQNVVAARPEPRVTGYVGAANGDPVQVEGDGTGTVQVRVVAAGQVPDDHLMKIAFDSHPDSVHAETYVLVDSTTHEVFFRSGRDFDGQGIGPVGAGLLPVVTTQRTVAVDTAGTGFIQGSPTNAIVDATYQLALPINLRRPGFPDDMTVVFSDVYVDTSTAVPFYPATPAKFRVIAHTKDGDVRMKFRFRDRDADGTLSNPNDLFDVLTFIESKGDTAQPTWRFQRAAGTSDGQTLRPPGRGDVYELRLTKPYGSADILVFRVSGEHVDPQRAQAEFSQPYVVPNPYVGSASFEPERFAISGRGERRMEFRNLPQRCVVKIYTVRGELVQTLRHDGSLNGMVPWNLRTKDNLDVAPGLYIFHVDGGETGSYTGKFAIVK